MKQDRWCNVSSPILPYTSSNNLFSSYECDSNEEIVQSLKVNLVLLHNPNSVTTRVCSTRRFNGSRVPYGKHVHREALSTFPLPTSLFQCCCLVLVASGRNHKTLQSNTHVIRIYTYLQTYYLYTRYLSGIIPIGACWLLPSPPLPTTRKHRVVPATSQFRCTRKTRQQWGWLHHTTLPMVVDWRFPLAVFLIGQTWELIQLL